MNIYFWGHNVRAIQTAKVNSTFRKNAVQNLIKQIEDEKFKSRSKDGCLGAFSRDRKLTFEQLIIFLTRGVISTTQRELNAFYKQVKKRDFNIQEITKGAFTQSRGKLKPEAFLELNDNLCATFYNEAPYLVWHDLRLLSVDGTRLVLPNHPSIKEEFGEHGFGPNADSNRSLALGSLLYDCLNLTTLDARVAPYSCSERDLLFQHLEKVNLGDLLLFDRGYPSIALFFLLIARGIEFCARMKETWWLVVKDFSESGEQERIVEFSLPKKDRELLKEYPEYYHKTIKCRLVRVVLPGGEVEILCTSLTNSEKYKYEDFEELYHLRWNIEEGYKLFKARVEVENFSGKTAKAVKQDFFAKVFMMTLCAVLAFPIEEKVRKESWEKKKKKKIKHEQKINRTSALSMVRDICIGLFIHKTINTAITAFDNLMIKTKEIVRPNRRVPRNKRPKKLFHMNYKAL